MPKGASMRWETVHPTGSPPHQAQATNTIEVPPAASPEKSSDTGRIFEKSGTLSEKDTQMFEELYSNMVHTC
jgi:hypothetical protein